jgi:4-hydroxybenzoate polyprenyltransferase
MMADAPAARSLRERVTLYGRMIKFSHSVFALPFALASFAIATQGRLPWRTLLWVLVAMVGARSAAMGFNRLADHRLDALNPRTAGRELPRGALSRAQVWAFVLLSSAALVLAAAMLNPLCLALSPVALLLVLGYSYTKRFTPLSHLALGLGLAIAPVGAWLAVRGSFSPVPLALALAVVCWVAGFDVIYACQDLDFDRKEGLRSIPARWGVAGALWIARSFHLLAVGLLIAVGVLGAAGWIYAAGVGLVAVLLVYEHSLVKPGDLSRVNQAFFLVNGLVSVGFFCAVLLDRLAGGGRPAAGG